jgi:hypothetical protein
MVLLELAEFASENSEQLPPQEHSGGGMGGGSGGVVDAQGEDVSYALALWAALRPASVNQRLMREQGVLDVLLDALQAALATLDTLQHAVQTVHEAAAYALHSKAPKPNERMRRGIRRSLSGAPGSTPSHSKPDWHLLLQAEQERSAHLLHAIANCLAHTLCAAISKCPANQVCYVLPTHTATI